MSNRRDFISKTTTLGLGAFGINSLFNQLHGRSFREADKTFNAGNQHANEDYWTTIQNAFTTNQSDIINLNNGGVSPSPIVVQKALEQYNAYAAQAPSYFMWRNIDKGREPLRERLAGLVGCDAEEIAINRNATEALNTIIYGLPLKKGDEVIGTYFDYGNMMDAWKQRQMRDGIVYTQIPFKFPIENDEIIVDAFAKAISKKTKLLHITHVINWVGQILPVKKICDMAHARGVEVLVDGAHSFGLLNFKISDLNCDYFGTSLHKFLCAPVGSGLMYIKKEKIAKIWPLLCSGEPQGSNIRKFESIGTRSFCIEQAIGEAINFHEGIGSQRKQERVHFLKRYWADKALQIPKVKLHTSLKPEYSCAIACFSIDGTDPRDLEAKLLKEYQIHTVPIIWQGESCVRVTPNVYTRLQDLDKFVSAIEKMAAKA